MAQIDWSLLNTNAPAQIAGAFTQGMDAETARQNALVERAYLAKKRQMEEDAAMKAIADEQKRQAFWATVPERMRGQIVSPQQQALSLKGGPTIFTSELASGLKPQVAEPDLTPIATEALQFPQDRQLAMGLLDKETARREKEQQALRDIQARKLLDPKEAWKYTKASRDTYSKTGNVADLEYDTETVKKAGGGGVAGQSIVYGADGNVHLVNRYTGQITPTGLPAAQYSPDLKGRLSSASEQGKIIGKDIGTSTQQAVTADADFANLQNSVDSLLNAPGFKQSVGMGIPGLKYVPGSTAADWNAQFDKLQGGIFLKAYQMIRGAGQITNVEGEKATSAMSAMKTATSEAEFKRAANDFVESVRQGMVKIKNTASQGIGGFKPVGAAPTVEQPVRKVIGGKTFEKRNGNWYEVK